MKTFLIVVKTAKGVCDALNLIERLKLRRIQTRINQALQALEDLEKGLKEEDISR